QQLSDFITPAYDVEVSLGSQDHGLVIWNAGSGRIDARLVGRAGVPASQIAMLGAGGYIDSADAAYSKGTDAAAVAWRNAGSNGASDQIYVAFYLGPLACDDIATSAAQGVPVSIPLRCTGPGITSGEVVVGPSHGVIEGLP